MSYYAELGRSVLLLTLLTGIISTVSADLQAFQNSKAYDSGSLGPYPVQYFSTSDVIAPHVNFAKSSERCDDGMYTFLSPRGRSVAEPGPVILDNEGNLIWTQAQNGQTYNLMVQEYRGQQYLTFWLGDDAIAGHGSGTYYMLDSSYNEVGKFSAANKLDGDLHEFRLTDAGTALLTVYQVYPADLTDFPGKTAKGYIWDGIFQEIDLQTGSLIFQWRASDHYNISDTYENIGNRGWPGDAFDFFHINSVEKDPKGNYLVSSRYTHSVTYIDGQSGDIIWILGGKRNMFKDLSDGAATDFAWQHDARWHDDYTSITVFDNGAESGHYTAQYSRGLKVALDFEKMTARVVAEYIHPNGLTSSSQGSVQVLPSGNVLIGYGYSGAFTEYSGEGEVLCDVHFGSRARWETGDVQSYRVLKYNWVGRPTTKPAILIENGVLSVSWNGATEVKTWVIQDSDTSAPNDNNFWPVAAVQKDGFETHIDMGDFDRNVKAYVRVAAIDKEGSILGTSTIIATGAKKVASSGLAGLRLYNFDTRSLIFLIAAVAMGTMVIAGWFIVTVWKAKDLKIDSQSFSWSRRPLLRPGFPFVSWTAVRRDSIDSV